MTEKTAQKEPGKKPVPSKKPKPQQEVVVQIPLSELHPFPDHPFQVREDASMQETAESVKEYGVLVPALARPREDGGYELIAGHRRKHACVLPSGMALDQAAVIADLCRQGMVHGVLRGGDPRVSGHPRQFGKGRFCERDPFYYSVHVCLLCIKLGVLYLSL